MSHLALYTRFDAYTLFNNLISAARNSPAAISIYDDGWLTTATAATTAPVSTGSLPAAICSIHDATGRYEGRSYATAVTAVLW